MAAVRWRASKGQVTAPKYHDTSYFLFMKGQLMSSNSTLAKF